MKIFETLFFVLTIGFISVFTTESVGLPLQSDQNLITKTVQLANSKNISDSRAWKKLLHLEPNIFRAEKTQVVSPQFFLSKQPEFSNQSELEATLRGFLEDPKKYEKQIEAPTNKLRKISDTVVDHSQHPICLFPARLKFLRQQLSDAPEYWQKLPKVECVFQKIFLEALSAKSVSYVFSSYYADSPGSAFGHTFFRINRSEDKYKTQQELLDYGVGYAASVTVSNGFLYALLGLAGGFNGTWVNVPYYYKVREYNDFEARDLWSYDLNLTADEVEMLSLHLWEVGSNHYTYYFFTQNCAFHMLTALEAAAPRLHLIQHVPEYYVIPADSLKALFYEPGLVKKISFRPSIRKTFLARIERLDEKSKLAFTEYTKASARMNGDTADVSLYNSNYSPTVDNFISSLNTKQKAYFLDAAIDLFDLRHKQSELESRAELRHHKEELLLKRAKVDFLSDDLEIQMEADKQPGNSHGSSRFGLSAFNFNNRNYGLIEYRFALHDLLDSQSAMPNNSQLEFFNFSFKATESSFNIKDFSFFKVLNLNPVNFFEFKPSWGLDLGIQDRPKICDNLNDRCPLAGVTARFGLAKILPSNNDRLVGFNFLTANFRYNDSLPKTTSYLAPGAEIGLLNRFSDEASMISSFNIEFPIGRDQQTGYLVEFRKSFEKKFQIGARAKDDNFGLISYWYF